MSNIDNNVPSGSTLVLVRKVVPNFWEYFIVDRVRGEACRWIEIEGTAQHNMKDLERRLDPGTFTMIDVTAHYRPEGHAF